MVQPGYKLVMAPGICHDKHTGINSERHHVGEDKSATQYLVPILYLLHRVRYLGKKGEESAALLQLPADEKTERRQADVGRMATACHRKMGEIAGQASTPPLLLSFSSNT